MDLVLDNTGIVYETADRLGTHPIVKRMARADRIQSGMLGLVRAAKFFDPARKRPFHAYARQSITNQIIKDAHHNLGMKRPVKQHATYHAHLAANTAQLTPSRPLSHVEPQSPPNHMKEVDNRDLCHKILAFSNTFRHRNLNSTVLRRVYGIGRKPMRWTELADELGIIRCTFMRARQDFLDRTRVKFASSY